ncbi:MAG: amino acid adenylation domain-containing protein [bacterium]|nr:amino acid adenylation domain-containing protein [bacterium]
MPLSLVDLLQRSAVTYPQRPAVALPGGPALTYAELERESARIAAALISLGVRRGDRVGLAVPKSTQAVVGLWGVLRTGAAYVPIDPASPPRRAAFIAANCEMAAILASGDLRETAEAIHETVPGIRILQVHGEELDGLAQKPEDILAGSDGDGVRFPNTNVRDLAYILYTSGSTGEPKGVMVSHGAALSFVEWGAWRFELGPEDILSNHAPLHFDLSTFDLFAAALAGAKVVVLDEETVRFPIAASGVLESEKITTWYSVPGALRGMLRRGRLARRDLRHLRTVLFAGESYPAEELHALQAVIPEVALYNLFGPTETNVCTYWRVPPQGSWSFPSIPIGWDCENCEGVVVGADLKPVPDGTPGELLVRGGTLMEGYWGDAERTAASFVPDFLHPHLSDQLYHTGDIVSRQPDGSYALHGRADHMVKIRGYRVELGEIENALHRVEGVVEAAVAAVERRHADGPETELVAFVTAAEGVPQGSEGEARLRRQLAERLPKYMVPAEFQWLDRLPSTSTGKVDRQALAAAAEQPDQ